MRSFARSRTLVFSFTGQTKLRKANGVRGATKSRVAIDHMRPRARIRSCIKASKAQCLGANNVADS